MCQGGDWARLGEQLYEEVPVCSHIRLHRANVVGGRKEGC